MTKEAVPPGSGTGHRMLSDPQMVVLALDRQNQFKKELKNGGKGNGLFPSRLYA